MVSHGLARQTKGLVAPKLFHFIMMEPILLLGNVSRREVLSCFCLIVPESYHIIFVLTLTVNSVNCGALNRQCHTFCDTWTGEVS